MSTRDTEGVFPAIDARLTPADVGRRVVVRHLLADGHATDVLGELESWSATALSLRPRDRTVVDIALAAVVAGKVVPARQACDVAVGQLQRIASEGWRALDRDAVGSWELRASRGWSRRCNSVLPVGSPGMALDDALTTVREWYAARGQRSIIQVPLPLCERLDVALDQRGWVAEAPTLVLSTDLDGRRTARGAGADEQGEVSTSAEPSQAWLSAVGELPTAAIRVLTGGDNVFASTTSTHGTLLGVARGSRVEQWLGISNVWVAQAHRRQGVATRLMSVLLDGASQTARHAYVQVEVDNSAARSLYADLGFAPHHSYVYRVAP